jgi:hypothetical protein
MILSTGEEVIGELEEHLKRLRQRPRLLKKGLLSSRRKHNKCPA